MSAIFTRRLTTCKLKVLWNRTEFPVVLNSQTADWVLSSLTMLWQHVYVRFLGRDSIEKFLWWSFRSQTLWEYPWSWWSSKLQVSQLAPLVRVPLRVVTRTIESRLIEPILIECIRNAIEQSNCQSVYRVYPVRPSAANSSEVLATLITINKHLYLANWCHRSGEFEAREIERGKSREESNREIKRRIERESSKRKTAKLNRWGAVATYDWVLQFIKRRLFVWISPLAITRRIACKIQSVQITIAR